MENAVVVGGNVGGNISSCQYKFQEITTARKNLFVEMKASIGVNNCSGEEIRTDYWAMSADPWLIFLFISIGLFILTTIIKMFFDW